MEYLVYVIGGGAVSLLAGLITLAVVRVRDRRNYLIQKATPLPLRLVNVSDDVWLTGLLKCDSPLCVPHFGLECVHYRYKLEERVTETHRDSKGRTQTRTRWKTRQQKRETAPFRLEDEGLAIAIDEQQAAFEYLPSRTEQQGSWRHTASLLPYPAKASAVGVVSEGKSRLEKDSMIPLIVTPLERSEYVKKTEAGEKIGRWVGGTLLLIGFAGLFYGLFDRLNLPAPTGGQFSLPTLILALVPSGLLFLCYWLIYTFNTFVEYRQRVSNAWSQVDVDLTMRYQLIPQLVSVARGYMTHERELLESLTQARSEAGAGRAGKLAVEGQVAGQMQTLLARVEAYPDLKAQPVLVKLTREITAIEEKIAHGRTIYNEAVTEYNNTIELFPKNLLAGACRFLPLPLFSVPPEQAAAPQIS